jgi:DNA gyrase/topoisomerase IV subunit A
MLIRVPVSSIAPKGRNIQGVRVVKLDEGDRVVAAVKVVDRDTGDGESDVEDEAGDDGESAPPEGEGAPEGEEPVH